MRQKSLEPNFPTNFPRYEYSDLIPFSNLEVVILVKGLMLFWTIEATNMRSTYVTINETLHNGYPYVTREF